MHTYSNVPVTIQKLTLLASGEYICHQVDDGVLMPQSLDTCLKQIDACAYYDILNMRYSEGVNFTGGVRPPEFWNVNTDNEFNLSHIDQSWATSVQPMMRLGLFIAFGGFDCRFEYSNHCHHDFMFRSQLEGGNIVHSSCGVCRADHMPGCTGDHAPIHNAQLGPDLTLFKELWSSEREAYLKYNNYEAYDKPWTRRFKKLYVSYDEMVNDQ